MNFRTVDSPDPLFDYAFKIECMMDILAPVSVLYPQDGNVPSELTKTAAKYCFPLQNNGCVHWDESVSVYILQKDSEPIKYLYVRYFPNAAKVVSVSIVSRFLHIRLFSKIFCFMNDSNPADLLAGFAKAPFQVSFYDIICPSPQPDFACPYVLAPRSEVASMHKYFFTYFPPYYAAWLMVFLMTNLRVFVVSSSTSHITQTIMSILSLFYPVTNPLCPVSLVLDGDEVNMDSFTGPCLAGFHTSTFSKVEKKVKKTDVVFNLDHPYLSCDSMPKYNSGLPSKILEFHNSIHSLTSHMQPAFPSHLILNQTTNFMITFIGNTFDVIAKDFTLMVNQMSKTLTGGGGLIENAVSRSPIVRDLVEKTEDENKEYIDLFWTENEKGSGLQKALELSTGLSHSRQSFTQKRSKTFLGFFR